MTFELKYCGICHTDVHIADNDMGRTHYPCVPGHELAGVVTTVGSNVTNYKVRRMVVHIVLMTGSWKNYESNWSATYCYRVGLPDFVAMTV